MTAPLCEYCKQPTTDCGPDGYGGTDWWCLNPQCEGLLGFARRIVPKQPTPLAAALAVPEVRALVEAAKSGLRFVENTEGELGIVLGCGDALRAALAALRGEGRS